MGIYKFFDKLEDHVRGFLSHFPIWYAFVGGTGLVIFWRGVWHSMDYLVYIANANTIMQTDTLSSELVWWDGPLSLLIGIVILLATGLFVSDFIGNEVIISGIKGEKKLSEKSEKEIRHEEQLLRHMDKELRALTKQTQNPKPKPTPTKTRS